MSTAWKLDLVVRKDRPYSIEELARRERVMVLGVDTATAKLEWAKQASLDFAYIEHWIAELGLGELWNAVREP